jgi:epoxyqueuosine reductase
MCSPASGPVTFDALSRFFAEQKVPVFSVADISQILAPAGRHPRDILPSCRTIIIFAVVMPDRFFFGTGKEQSDATNRIKKVLESTAYALRDLLEQNGSRTEAIVPFLRLVIEDGNLRGRLSLKHCAADAGLGTLGDNSLLIHPRYGNRLALAAVVTEQAIGTGPATGGTAACTHCNRCTDACAAGAIRGGVVTQTSCRNLTDYVPRPFRPLAWRMMRGRWSARLVTVLLNMAASRVEIRGTCTACMTVCPHFKIPER